MRNVTATIQTKPRRNRQQQQQRGPKRSTVDVNVKVEGRRPKEQGRKRDQRGSKTALAYPKSGNMVAKPSDSKATIGESNATRSVKGDVEQIATQMIAPHFTGVVKRAPCVVNFKNHLTKFNTALTLTIPASGKLVGRFTPTPAFIELANDSQQPPNGVGFDARFITESADDNKGYAEVSITNEYAGVVRSVFNGQTDSWMYPIIAPAGTVITVTNGGDPVDVFYIDSGGGQHSDVFNAMGVATMTADSVLLRFRYANGALGVSSFTAQFNNGGFAPATLFAPSGIQLPESTQTLRTTLLTGLVTFTGSSLENGGNIVSALVDPNWYPAPGDIFDVLSALPDRRYNGALKKGTYGWWMPARLEEETPQDASYFDRNPRTSAIWFAISGASPGQSVKVEGNTGVEFYSPEQVYSHVPCIAKSPIYGHLFDLFNHLPHVMPNDDHDEMCKGMLSKVRGSINNAIKNPATLCLGIAALA